MRQLRQLRQLGRKSQLSQLSQVIFLFHLLTGEGVNLITTEDEDLEKFARKMPNRLKKVQFFAFFCSI